MAAITVESLRKKWPELLGSAIGVAIMVPLYWLIWANSHWSVALVLTAYYVDQTLEKLKRRLRPKR